MNTKVGFLVVMSTQLFFGSQANAQDLMKCAVKTSNYGHGLVSEVLHCTSYQNDLMIKEASLNGGNCRAVLCVGAMGCPAYSGGPIKFGVQFRILQADDQHREECRKVVQWVLNTNKGTLTFSR